MKRNSIFIIILATVALLLSSCIIDIPCDYTITYMPGNEKGVEGKSFVQYKNANKPVTLKSEGFTLSGDTLIGWTTSPDGKQKKYELGAEYSENADLVLYPVWQIASCLAKGTLITMADGSQKKVENLKIGDVVKTINHDTGELSSSEVYGYLVYENMDAAFTLHFEDAIDVTIVDEHAFFDKQANNYVFITFTNYKNFIGHEFYNVDTNSWKKLVSVTLETEKTDAYYVFTKNHFNCVANGMLSTEDLSYDGVAYPFDFLKGTLKFDPVKKAADIEKYGLLDSDDVPEISQDDFEAYNMQFLKIYDGKGYIDIETVIEINSSFYE